MNIQIDGQGMSVTDALRALTLKKIERSLSHIDNINSIHIIYKVESEIQQTANATVTVPGSTINAHAKSEDMYKTLDILIHNLESQLKKYRDKKTDHHRE